MQYRLLAVIQYCYKQKLLILLFCNSVFFPFGSHSFHGKILFGNALSFLLHVYAFEQLHMIG